MQYKNIIKQEKMIMNQHEFRAIIKSHDNSFIEFIKINKCKEEDKRIMGVGYFHRKDQAQIVANALGKDAYITGQDAEYDMGNRYGYYVRMKVDFIKK
jgi:hypothetical protein